VTELTAVTATVSRAKEIGMDTKGDRLAADSAAIPVRPSRATNELLRRDRMRWDEIQRLFELCRERPRDDWHALLRTACEGRESIAFEVMTLLVAAENLPPIEESCQKAT
jgi:hypothetical protein